MSDEVSSSGLPIFCAESGEVALFVLAYYLGNFLRRRVLPRRIKHGSLRSLLTQLIKIGAKVVWHSRIVTCQMAEVASKQGELCRDVVSD